MAYGRIYIGNTDDKLYSFVASTGQVAWTYTMPNWAYGSPAVSNGRVFATSFDGTFAAFNARTGAVLWRHKLPYRGLSSPTVIGHDVYVADLGPSPSVRSGRLFGYDAGAAAWCGSSATASTPRRSPRPAGSSSPGATHIYVLRPRAQ